MPYNSPCASKPEKAYEICEHEVGAFGGHQPALLIDRRQIGFKSETKDHVIALA